MSYQVLARKWRPKSFDTLVGQPHVVRALTNALEQQRLHHAYLFTGTRGVGKTTIARILAKSLNCETGITANPCGVCSACTDIDKGRFIDLIEVDAASNTQVDAMRELLDNAQYAPTAGRFKVYIIDEVHMLSKSAFNAMLKTLEEPPSHVKFILATTDPQKVPVTVLSRCLQFNLRQMASTTITEHLSQILQQEHIQYDAPALHLIARAAAGSMRDALSLTDQAIAYGNQTVNEAEVRSMLGAIDQSYLYEIIQALLANDSATLISKAKDMDARSISFDAALGDLSAILHQIAIAKTCPNTIASDLPEHAALMSLAQSLSPETLQLYYQISILGRRDIGLAPDEYAGFTMTLLRMLAFTPQEKLDNASPLERIVPTTSATTPNSMPSVSMSARLNALQKKSETQAEVAEPALEATSPAVLINDGAVNAEHAETERVDTVKEATSTQPMFQGDWRTLVEQQLKLGLARALAQNCEMVTYDEHSITLKVAETHKHLVSPNYQDKLSEAIAQHFGRKIKLLFEIGSEANTPAKQNAIEKATIQSNAESAILQDGFVQALMNDFGATIIPNSIKPTQ
ncbi:MAG: DNA polymerase III subunit gamma/tau [Methylophilaceae bacterium 17-44-8]|nr:MAG: DNA polymerase III subunit gamma/tau [Methylophilales bacterium 28-44-11]OZA06609.1 MAG: DNA polymerase III subunit gamma/tau [Methylophilaceae bacterium 17-44-8]